MRVVLCRCRTGWTGRQVGGAANHTVLEFPHVSLIGGVLHVVSTTAVGIDIRKQLLCPLFGPSVESDVGVATSH